MRRSSFKDVRLRFDLSDSGRSFGKADGSGLWRGPGSWFLASSGRPKPDAVWDECDARYNRQERGGRDDDDQRMIEVLVIAPVHDVERP